MDRPWRAVWAACCAAIVDGIPPEALNVLRPAFNKGGATDMRDLFNVLNGQEAFTGTKAEQNLATLLLALKNWEDTDALVKLRNELPAFYPTLVAFFPAAALYVHGSVASMTPRQLHTPGDLVGRETLIYEAIEYIQRRQAEMRCPIVVLRSPKGIPGGTGKTAVALAIAEHMRLKLNQRGSQVRANLFSGNGSVNPKSAMRDVITQVYGTLPAKEMIRDDKSTQHTYDCLFGIGMPLHAGVLFLDDASSEEQIVKLIPKHSTDNCTVLVTTRLDFTLPITYGALHTEVRALDKAASLEWLQKALLMTQSSITAEDSLSLVELAKMCRGIPLLLQLVETRLREAGEPVVRLLEQAKQAHGYAMPMHESLAKSFSLLLKEEKLCFLHCVAFGVPFSREDFRKVFPKYNEHISKLVSVRFLFFDHSKNLYSVHDVIRDFIERNKRLGNLSVSFNTRRPWRDLAQKFYVDEYVLCETKYLDHLGAKAAIQAFLNIRQGLDWAICSTDLRQKWAALFLKSAGPLYRYVVPPSERLQVVNLIHLQSSELDAESQVSAHILRGQAHEDAGFFEIAEEELRQAVMLAEKTLDRFHVRTLMAKNSLGWTLVSREKDEAVTLQQNTLEQFLQVHAEPHLIALAHDNLGFALNYFGTADKAEEHHRRAVDLLQAKLGPLHPLVATAMANRALAFIELKRFKDSVPLLDQAASIYAVVVGTTEQPDCATATFRRGTALEGLGNIQEARNCFQQALAVREKLLGVNHPDSNRARRALESLNARGTKRDKDASRT